MATVRVPENLEADPRVKAVFDDIRATRNTEFINNVWHYLAASDPVLLERIWAEVKDVMATPSALDPVTKDLIYMAMSIANGCNYCVHSHTASARAKGMTDEIYADFLRVVALAAKTNSLATALQIPVDQEFDAEA